MGIRELARKLDLSPTLISRLVRRGMPTDPEGARAWREAYVKRKEVGPPPVIPIAIDERGDNGIQNLESTLERLRQQERDISTALSTLLKAGRLAEVASLRREHAGLVKTLFESETRALKIGEARGRLISLDTALTMISQAMAEPLIMLRRLPDMAKDPEQKQALEAFLAAVLGAIRDGAAESLKERREAG